MRYHKIIKYTVAKVSFTLDGVRYKEVLFKYNGLYTKDIFTFYNKMKSDKKYLKFYVHEIVEAYYWEE